MKKSEPKNNKKSENTYSENEMKRYLGALNETHGKHLKAIKEGFDVINRKLDSHTEMIGTIMEDVSILKNDTQVIKGGLKKKVDYDEFISLVQRVNKLEKA